MKRFTLTLAFALLIAMPTFAERVTSETARKVATTFLNNNGAKALQLTELPDGAGFPNLFIFTTEESFVVMAADDRVQPILGYSLHGTFLAEGMPDNVRSWLQGYNDEIQYAIDNQMRATTETAKQWKDLAEGKPNVAKATSVVDPLIQTKWNQNRYYNNLCPAVSDGPNGHAYTGCVATAMAQIMKYWEYPSNGIGTHSYTWNGQTLSADFNSTTYDWDNMQLYYDYYYTTGTASSPVWLNPPTSEQLSAIATLMYHCGVSVNMEYGGNSTGGSSAASIDAANALKTYFNYSPNIEYKEKNNYDNDVWIGMVKAELNAQRPLQYSGRGSGGHAFVCDGYNNADYFHFNWGWSGAYDGYFSLDNLNTGANNQSGQGNGIYTYNQAAIFGIQPVECSASAPTNLTYTLTGLQTLTLSWTAANGAESYNIYCNNNCIGTSTTTTYSTIAPFGTTSYYVRSVDAGGNLSLSSNSVTVTVEYRTPNVENLNAALSGNDVSLSWTAPEWCYPEYESANLNYGIGEVYYSWTPTYYAHRHLASNIAQYAGKVVYKVSTFIQYPGTYSLYIYSKSNASNRPDPNSLAANINQVNISSFNTWYEFELSTPVILTGTDDLWVVIKQTNTGQQFPVPSFELTSHNTNAFYAGSSPTYLNDCHSGYNCAWLINTYLTDGTYTYNLYQDGTKIAENISNTTYEVSLNDNTANQFVVKTIYYDGEAPSNMIGYAKGEASLASMELNPNDKMTVIEGSKLTVNGDLTNDDPANLVLEDGAQLVHSSDGVKATVQKSITPYTTDEDGWQFIASPVTEAIEPSTDNGLLTNSYDLYLFDQSQEKEWRNIEAGAFTTIDHKTGYLYANNTNTTLSFEGTLVATTDATPLAYDGNAILKGFNLIGNPYPCNTTIPRDFYVISGNIITLAGINTMIAPCEGVFVKATDAGESVTFTKATTAKGTISSHCLDLVITNNYKDGVSASSTAIDRARVRFGEGIGMEKFGLDNLHTQISLWQNGQKFAVAYVNGWDELPVLFKASQDGTYSLSMENNGFELNYLHLIDNMTGNDVDLLATPSYTFEAKTTDYASRFRLVFAPNCEDAVGDNAPFAYVSNGEIVINGVNNNASLQIVDVTGRVIVSVGGHTRCVPIAGVPAGVYVLRLINSDGVKTQKIVIE